MKNFSQTIDLGALHCCCVREGASSVNFLFWMRQGDSVLDAKASKDYRHIAVVDALFDYQKEALTQEAMQVAETVMAQLEKVEPGLQDGVALTIKNPLQTSTEDDEDDNQVYCAVCGGFGGESYGSDSGTCENCGGSGRVDPDQDEDEDDDEDGPTCSFCGWQAYNDEAGSCTNPDCEE